MNLIECLTNFNLTKQEATLYVLLLKSGQLTGYEAAKQTGISRSNTYTALAGLVDKGAAYILEEGKVTRYTPVAPEEFCTNKIDRLVEIKKNCYRSCRCCKVMPRVISPSKVSVK